MLREYGSGVPLYLVRGNNDGEWAAHLPVRLEFILDGIKFCLVHDKKDLPQNLKDCQSAIFGHSHRYLEEDFVEDICRIRVTHPGVTVNGILDKIEVNQKIQKSRGRKINGSE